MPDLPTALAALIEKEMAEAADQGARYARDDVRCIDCNLRYAERQEYGCQWEGNAHSYDEGDLAAAAELGRQVDPDCVSISVTDLRSVMAAADPVENDLVQVLAQRDDIRANRDELARKVADQRATLGRVGALAMAGTEDLARPYYAISDNTAAIIRVVRQKFRDALDGQGS